MTTQDVIMVLLGLLNLALVTLNGELGQKPDWAKGIREEA